jgi:hypothetical protein
MMTLEDCRFFYAQEVRWAANLSSQALIDAYARVPREKYLGPPPWQILSADLKALSLSGLGSMVQRKTDEPRDPAKHAPDSARKFPITYRTTDDPRDLYHDVLVALDAAREINNGQPSALAVWINALDLKAGDRAYHLGCGVGYYTATIPAVPTVGGGIMTKITRWGDKFSAEIISPVGILSCSSMRDPQLELLLMKALGSRSLQGLKSVRLDPHVPTETCLVHGSGVCLSSAEPGVGPPASTA